MSMFSSRIQIKGLSKNKVDKEVQTLLFPLNLLKSLCFNPNYRIKKGFISPNNRVNKLISLCVTVFCLSTHLYNYIVVMLDENMNRYQTIHFLYFASSFDVFSVSAGFIMNYITNFIQTKENVTFVLTFQEVHRFLNKNVSSKTFIIVSWIHVGLTIGFFFLSAVFMNTQYFNPPWYTTSHVICLMTLDSDSVYAIRLVRLLTEELVLWMRRGLSRKYSQNEEYCQKMFETYGQMLKCYEIIRKHYQPTVS